MKVLKTAVFNPVQEPGTGNANTVCSNDMRSFTDYRPRCLISAELNSKVREKMGGVTTQSVSEYMGKYGQEHNDFLLQKSVKRMNSCILPYQLQIAEQMISAGLTPPENGQGVAIPSMYKNSCDRMGVCTRTLVDSAGFGEEV